MKVFRSLVNEVLLFVCGVAGLNYGVTWALNLFLFLAWLRAVVMLLFVFMPSVRSTVSKKGLLLPFWLTDTLRLLIVGLLASSAFYSTAVVVFVDLCCLHAIFDTKVGQNT